MRRDGVASAAARQDLSESRSKQSASASGCSSRALEEASSSGTSSSWGHGVAALARPSENLYDLHTTVTIVGREHPRRHFGERSIDSRHYLPELARKPQAVRRGPAGICCAFSASRFAVWGVSTRRMARARPRASLGEDPTAVARRRLRPVFREPGALKGRLPVGTGTIVRMCVQVLAHRLAMHARVPSSPT